MRYPLSFLHHTRISTKGGLAPTNQGQVLIRQMLGSKTRDNNAEMQKWVFRTNNITIHQCAVWALKHEKSKAWAETQFHFLLCVQRVKDVWDKYTHVIIFSLKWRSQGSFFHLYRGKVAATSTLYLPPSNSFLIRHNSNQHEYGKMEQRHYF